MVVIDSCDCLEESNKLERFYIEKYTNDGLKLTNSYSGDVTEVSKETCEKISQSRKGKKLEEIVGHEKSLELKSKYSERMKLNKIQNSIN
jgi:hypothetical protein